MKAFFVGLLFLVAVGVLSGIGVLLFPLLMVLALLARVIIVLALVVFAIWLLGKFILYVWQRLK